MNIDKYLSLKNNALFYPLLLTIIVFFSFSPVLNAEFITWDDASYLLDNLNIRHLTWHSLYQLFQSTILNVYVPLTVFTFAIEYHFFKLNPFVYHFDNLILHIGVVLLVFFLFLRMGFTRNQAFLASLIFGIHPLKVEAVAWVTARKDVLYSVFYLLAVHVYLNFISSQKKYLLPVVYGLGLLSMLAKPMAASLPLILLLFDWYFHRRDYLRMIVEKIPMVVLILPILWISYAIDHGNQAFNSDIVKFFLPFVWSFVFYLFKFIYPFFLPLTYKLPSVTSFENPEYQLALLGFIGILIFLWIGRKHKWLVFSFVFYFLSIFLALRYDEVYRLSSIADRYMYLPSLGFCGLFGVFIAFIFNKFFKNRNIVILFSVALLFLIASFFVKTFRQCKVWKNSDTYWSRVIEFHSDRYFAYLNRGVYFMEKGDYQRALEDFSQAIRVNPVYADGYFNRAALYDKQGLENLAVTDYQKAIEFDPKNSSAYNNLGKIYLNQGMRTEAKVYFEKSIAINPGFYQGYINLGNMYNEEGKSEQALVNYNIAIEIFPYMPETYFNRGNLYFLNREYQLAIEDYTKAIKLKPGFREAYENRAMIYSALDNLKDAGQDENAIRKH